MKSCLRIIEAFVVLKEATSNLRTYLTSSPRECAFYFFTDVISSERQSHPNITATPITCHLLTLLRLVTYTIS